LKTANRRKNPLRESIGRSAPLRETPVTVTSKLAIENQSEECEDREETGSAEENKEGNAKARTGLGRELRRLSPEEEEEDRTNKLRFSTRGEIGDGADMEITATEWTAGLSIQRGTPQDRTVTTKDRTAGIRTTVTE